MADIEGLQGLMDKLDELPRVMARKLIVDALRAGAEPIQERAAELAPDDPETPGSRIKESMMTSVVDQTAIGATAKIGPSRKGFVGQFAEFGTAHQSAEPFLRPAFDANVDEATRIIGETLAAGIEEALGQ